MRSAIWLALFCASCASCGTTHQVIDAGSELHPTDARAPDPPRDAGADLSANVTNDLAGLTVPIVPVVTLPPDLAGLVAARPYSLQVPSSYDASKAYPLVIALHGFGGGSNSAQLENYLHLGAIVDSRGFLYARPDGLTDKNGDEFWSATDACCNVYGSPVDDVGYLRALIGDVAAKYHVDAGRVFVMGLSAGGFMAHRAACDLADKVAAVISMSGATWKDAARCKPSQAVSVLELHGDGDASVSYLGGTGDSGGAYPSAPNTVAHWAAYDGCTGPLAPTGTRLDLDLLIPGAETRVERYGGCVGAPGIGVELWTVEGGGHTLHPPDSLRDTLVDFLYAHGR